jgi:hypothetical protein
MKRYDVLRHDKYEITPQGFLKVPVYAARTGIQKYMDKDGSVLREYRPPDEVFSEVSMKSMANAPITNNHPKEMVTPDNAKNLMVGYLDGTIQIIDNKFLKGYAIITDAQTINEVKEGKVEVSMGYDVSLDFVSGEYEGEKYDAIQRNIIYNHIAIVDKGRAGKEVRLRLDSKDAILIDNNFEMKGESMKIKLGDKEFEVNDELGKAINEMLAKKVKKDEENAALNTKISNYEVEIKKIKEDNEKSKAKIDSLEAEKTKTSTTQKDDEKKLDSNEVSRLVRERIKLEKTASRILDDKELEKFDSMADLEIKKLIIKKESPEINFDGKSEIYIDARYDHIAENTNKSKSANEKLGDNINQNRKQDSEKNEEEIELEKKRKESMKADSEAWSKPIGKSN